MTIVNTQENSNNMFSISFCKNFKLITQSNSSAILLSYLVMLNAQYGNREFYQTDEQIKYETALTENELRLAKNHLRKLGLIKTRKKKIEYYDQPVLHYLIQFDQIESLVALLKCGNHVSVNRGIHISGTVESTPKEDHEIKKDYEVKTYEAHSSNEPINFDLFWQAYPGPKVGKKKTKEAWVKAKPPIDIVLKACQMLVEQQSLFTNTNMAPTFLKHPTTWLNGECWNDEINLEADKKMISDRQHKGKIMPGSVRLLNDRMHDVHERRNREAMMRMDEMLEGAI